MRFAVDSGHVSNLHTSYWKIGEWPRCFLLGLRFKQIIVDVRFSVLAVLSIIVWESGKGYGYIIV